MFVLCQILMFSTRFTIYSIISMIDLDRLFENWFTKSEITATRKLSFADDLRDRLAANNQNGVFDVILPQLDASLVSAGGATSKEAVALAVRKAGVQAKTSLMAEIKALISRRSGRIADQFGKKSAEYTEFFPQGMSAYTAMNEAELEPGLDVIIAAATKYDAEMKTEFEALKASWNDARQAAGDKIAAVSAISGNQDLALAKLDEVLMKAIFTAALAFTGDTRMGPILFDQSRLYPAGQSGEKEPAVTPPVA
jgi:hypothetical protein